MSPWRRRLRRARRWTVGALAGLAITLGLMVAVLSRLLPMLESRPDEVARWLSQRAGVEVRIAAAHGEWNGSGVRLDLSGLELGGDDGVSIERAVLQVNVIAGLMPGTPLTSLQLQSPRIEAERHADGRWEVQGLGVGKGGAPPDLGLIERLGEIVLDGASLRLRDADRQLDWSLSRLDARLRTQGGRVRAGLRASLDGASPVQLVVDMNSALSEGEIYLRLPEGELQPWLQPWLPDTWNLPKIGLGLSAWIHLADARIESLQWVADLSGELAFGEGEAALASDASRALPSRQFQGQWVGSAESWQLIVQESGDAEGWLRLQHSNTQWELDVADLALAGWLPWLLHHPEIDLGTRARWLVRAPGGSIDALRVQGGSDRPLAAQGRLRGLQLDHLGDQPGFSGLDLTFDALGERAAVYLDAPDFRLDWPASLRQSPTPALRGNLMLWRDDDAKRSWCLSALDLELREPDYQIDAEGDLCFNGNKPRADLRVAVAPASIDVAKRFWIINKMPPAAVQWLDEALLEGQLASGQVLLKGDLDQWPFTNRGGRFEAIALLQDLRLNYRDDWPAGEQLGGEARFINDGMEVDLSAIVAGVEARRVTGGIERFRDARLQLQIDGQADGASMLGLLRASPLWSRLQVGLADVQIRGPGSIDLSLDIPLKPEDGEASLLGRVTLQDADLRQSAWGIAFDAARGDVVFSERGVRVEGMDVLHVGRPAKFSLAVGSFANDPANQTEAQLLGRLDAKALIDSQPDLNWLKDYLQGVSAWQINLAVPQLSAKVPSLHLQSDLVGTELNLPAPLRKSDAVAMAMDLQLELGSEAKSVDLRLGELLRLRGLIREGQPFNGLAEFGENSGVERPERGIAVVGQVPVLDTSAWLGMAVGGDEGLLHSVDLQCGEMDVLGRPFPETRVIYSAEGRGKRVRFEGLALDGEIEIPPLEEWPQRGITARFEHLHWPSSDEDKNATAGMDPRAVPALHVHARDLRLGEARLGNTRLESFPTPQGMRLEQFSASSEALELVARGDWRRIDGIDRSEFEVEFTAQDLGAMLRALGFADFVEGGQTLATLRADWTGPPASFGLDKAKGELVLSVGKGRIPDVEPGAGRLFGLLSLGEIPRRLALDFSDFFRSGLAFNRIEGTFALEQGVASTENLVIDSPAAEIRIRGQTSLQQQTYDQTMEVLPRAGNVLPVVGALAAGPAGAAIGAVAQAVLQKPFKQITRALYRVSGDWSKPTIDVIERGPSKAGGGGAAPAPDK